MEKPTDMRHCELCKKGPLYWGPQMGSPKIVLCNECLERAGVIRAPAVATKADEPLPHPSCPKDKDQDTIRRLEAAGVRYDQDKLAWHLVPMQFLEGMVRVLMFGAKKYAPHNWRKGLHYSRVTNSLQRHLNAFNAGEDIDPETDLPHVDHILCNALFLKGMTVEHPEMDDRHRTKKITSEDVRAMGEEVRMMKNPFTGETPRSQADNHPNQEQ